MSKFIVAGIIQLETIVKDLVDLVGAKARIEERRGAPGPGSRMEDGRTK